MAAHPLGLLGGPALEAVELEFGPEQDRSPVGDGHSAVNGEGRSMEAAAWPRGCALGGKVGYPRGYR